jgi:hypothetical protein
MMKKHISLLLLTFFSIAVLKAQEKKKDALFFSIDKYYTISPTIIPNLSKQSYSEHEIVKKQQMNHTKTNGYVFFVGNGFLTKDLKPKKILSIKKYIENRKFYFDGKHNQIIDKWKLKDSLTEKYTIYFINGNEFIQPRYIEYYSYYPIGKGENAVNNKIKDTLFFELDNSYVYQSKTVNKEYFIKDSSGSNNGTFFFQEIQAKNNQKIKPEEILSLENFVRSSKFFDKNKQRKLNDDNLAHFFSNYVVFLVEDNLDTTKYIQVKSSIMIE